MKFKLISLLFFSFAFVSQINAQRRSTSVKGYTKKDGTYVRPHTRNYSSGSSYSLFNSSSTRSNYSSSTELQKQQNNEQYLTYTSNYNGEKIEKSKLGVVQNYDEEQDSGNIIYVSVLYYNNIVLDICPVSRNIINKWEFDNVTHSFDKNKITSDNALELVSNYGWSISNQRISKSFKYASVYDKGSPTYLTKKIEAIKLK